MSKKQYYQKLLKELCNKLAAEQMSLLVGSGLSKNVSGKFPTWDQLLADLIYELHQRDIDAAYENYLALTPAVPKSKTEFREQECQHIIEQQGYLEIVSAYIRRKGLPESIVTYIEARVPDVRRQGDGYILDCNGTVEALSNEALALHKDLIDLPWNNIYTTNYDNLLDICIDNRRYDRLMKEVNQLGKDVAGLETEISKKENEKEALSKPEVQLQSATARLKQTEHSSSQQEENAQFEKKKWELSFEISRLRRLRQQKEMLMTGKEVEINRCYRVVKSASELSIKKRKNIIKLHGSIRSILEREKFQFEFDGDHKRQYIISKEDYESYPARHEAFTQLMRISLLQESFCLIGFSGSDPNFLQWISWVRDILYKAARSSDANNNVDNPHRTKSYKIYLLDVEEGEVPDDRQLFYANHNIVRIPLRDPDVVEIFQESLNIKLESPDRNAALSALIAYLGNDEHIKADIPTENILVREEYRQLWDQLPTLEHDKIPDEAEIESLIDPIKTTREQFWLPDLGYNSINKQHSLLTYINYQWQDQLGERPFLRSLTIAALADYAVPVRNALSAGTITMLATQPDNAASLRQFTSRNDALSVDWQSDLIAQHDEALRLAYALRFSELKHYLDSWQASGRSLIAKAGFLAVFDRQAAKDLLSKAFKGRAFDGREEIVYMLEMLRHLSFVEQDNKVASRLFLDYQRDGYKGLADKIEDLQKLVVKKQEKLEPYGAQRFKQVHYLNLSKDSDAEAALQLLMLLADTGFQLVVHNVYLLSSEDWYPVMKAGFEIYPWPFLFYALQYNNTDFLKRIGQEYVFSDAHNVSSQLNDICKALFTGLHDAPDELAKHIMVVLSGMVVGINPQAWQADFRNWWRDLIKNNLAFLDKHTDDRPLLIAEAVHYIEDVTIIEEIVDDCLREILKSDSNQSANILYQLARNRNYKILKADKNYSKPIPEQIDEIIAELNAGSISRIFVLGYLFHLLTTKQRKSITKQLLKIDFKQVTGARTWRVLLYFTDGQSALSVRLRQALLDHQLLWFTGIQGGEIHGSFKDEPIAITLLSYSELRKNGLKWNNAELKKIYERLKKNLSDIDRMIPNLIGGFFSFMPVLEEMVGFLTMFQSRLSKLADFQATLELATNTLETHRNYHVIEEGLTSHDSTAVQTALRELDLRIYLDNFRSEDIALILNRILLQVEPSVETSLAYIAIWLYYENRGERFRDQQPLLLQILRKYALQSLRNADRAFVEEKLTRIAWKLKTWQNQDPIINAWLKKAADSRFNNIRQFLASVKENDPDLDDD